MAQPVFIIGSPRSGTSVLTWAIGQHPNISVQPETNWMPTIAHAALDAYRIGTARNEFSQLSWADFPLTDFMAHFGKAIDAISRESFERRVELSLPDYRQGQYALDTSDSFRLIRSPDEPKARWVDGTPAYSFSTYALGLMFPDCKFIHILRRPDQVVNSLAHFENLGEEDTRSFSVSKALRVWRQHTLASQETADYFGAERVLRIDHADLAADGASTLARCFAFLGEPDCPHAAGVLGQKPINSSKADAGRDATLAKLQSNPHYREAHALYEALRTQAVPLEGDLSALEEQRTAFEKGGQFAGRSASAIGPSTITGKLRAGFSRLLGR